MLRPGFPQCTWCWLDDVKCKWACSDVLMACLNHSRPMLLECEAEVGSIYRKAVLVTVLVGHRNSLGRKRKNVRTICELFSFHRNSKISSSLETLDAAFLSGRSFICPVQNLHYLRLQFTRHLNFGALLNVKWFKECYICKYVFHHCWHCILKTSIKFSSEKQQTSWSGVNISIYCSQRKPLFDWNYASNHGGHSKSSHFIAIK